ncbi:hypothetical protein PgNI_10395 [Pyricularia grisea]|uniref:Uncharacterized protein n=1 Tax=Pyricularia grisea TaxID=148305 RepID=A0A6P8AX43_PYRGI|nr:hypothetical protein PgNI_10395 [Pyricularia grisea]TLD06910.1 hypothetical protein PgNI_10395 [Pyricularia grisea]
MSVKVRPIPVPDLPTWDAANLRDTRSLLLWFVGFYYYYFFSSSFRLVTVCSFLFLPTQPVLFYAGRLG